MKTKKLVILAAVMGLSVTSLAQAFQSELEPPAAVHRVFENRSDISVMELRQLIEGGHVNGIQVKDGHGILDALRDFDDEAMVRINREPMKVSMDPLIANYFDFEVEITLPDHMNMRLLLQHGEK